MSFFSGDFAIRRIFRLYALHLHMITCEDGIATFKPLGTARVWAYKVSRGFLKGTVLSREPGENANVVSSWSNRSANWQHEGGLHLDRSFVA